MSSDPGWREAWPRVRRLLRPIERWRPGPPVPPPLPPARIVDVPGRGELFVREVRGDADGTPMVLLHGWTMSADLTWWGAYERLGRVGRVVAPDLRGHGRGMRSLEPFTLEDAADDVAALLRELGTGPVVACGFSMGGPVALLLWQRHPDVVSGLVLMATALEWRASARERIVWRTMGILERVFRSTIATSLVDRYLRELIEQSPSLAEHRDWLRGEYRRGDAAAIAEAGRATGRFDARPFAGNVDVPCAVVLTTRDHLVMPSKQRALVRALRDVVVVPLDGDHDVCLTSVEAFSAAAAEGVASVVSRIGASTR